eukprot:Rhum_TRINITY_DN23512_c0_g1::Rhum_TRINITY_DN23512_c0_g1_i1::g.178183::m.178183
MSKQEGKVKQSCTHAMGMGNSTLAVECWKAQINKENQIRGDWRKKFAPHLEEKEAEVDMRWKDHLAETRRDIENIDPSTRGVLYEGVSKDGTGRTAYLKLRNKMAPQQKLRRAETTSQSVGWACSELPPVTRTGVTNFGRKPVIKNGFYRKGGVFTN